MRRAGRSLSESRHSTQTQAHRGDDFAPSPRLSWPLLSPLCSVYIKHTLGSVITRAAWTCCMCLSRVARAEGCVMGQQQQTADRRREPQNGSKLTGILKTALWTESGIPTKDKRGEKWMGRAAKGLCFISEYKAVSEIIQHIDNALVIGMRDLLTQLKVVFVCLIFSLMPSYLWLLPAVHWCWAFPSSLSSLLKEVSPCMRILRETNQNTEIWSYLNREKTLLWV